MISKKFWLIISCLILISSIFVYAEITKQWETDVNKALKTAMQGNKKILLAFCSPWCRSCKKMEKVVCRRNDIVAYMQKHYVTVKIDISKNGAIAGKYGIENVPSFVFLDAKGTVILKKQKYIYADTFLKYLKFVAEDYYKKINLNKYMDK